MAETRRLRLWLGRLGFVGLATVLIFVQLMPRETLPPVVVSPDAFFAALFSGAAIPTLLVGPDMILCVVLVWVSRRPDLLPGILVAALMLLTDLLFQRPPGLWAALVLILTEMLRARAVAMRALPFPVEWAGIAVGIVAITLINRTILSLTVTPQASFALVLSQMVSTILIYPLIVLAASLIFGVTRPGPGDVDATGKTF